MASLEKILQSQMMTFPTPLFSEKQVEILVKLHVNLMMWNVFVVVLGPMLGQVLEILVIWGM